MKSHLQNHPVVQDSVQQSLLATEFLTLLVRILNLFRISGFGIRICSVLSSQFRRVARCMPPAMVVVGCLLLFSSLALPAADAPPSAAKARILLVTGIDNPGHNWRETAPLLATALQKDPRLEVFTVEDPNFLDSSALAKYDVVMLHFQNRDQPGPGQHARENLRRFVESGKGLVLVHFACGAWFNEWPEFEKLAGRVWFGPNPPAGRRQHDPHGPFRVEFTNRDQLIVRGIADFDTTDELYTCLVGDYPIEVLAQAKSKVDGKSYPMAFISHYGKGRTFHCTLGNDVKALSVPEVQELYRRGCAWAAGLAAIP